MIATIDQLNNLHHTEVYDASVFEKSDPLRVTVLATILIIIAFVFSAYMMIVEFEGNPVVVIASLCFVLLLGFFSFQ